MAPPTKTPPSMSRRSDQSREALKAAVERAMRAFGSQRLPGVEYECSSTVTAKGELVLTFSPKGVV